MISSLVLSVLLTFFGYMSIFVIKYKEPIAESFQFSYLLSSSHGIYSKFIFRQQLNCICLNKLFFSIVLDKGSRKIVIDKKSYGRVVCCLKPSFETRNLKSQRWENSKGREELESPHQLLDGITTSTSLL